jgi:phenylpropionate dioxygenase-like ring-hydroxylating dioxygenase large terminal subunit
MTDPGAARSPGPTYQELLDADTHPVPDVLRLESPRYLGDEDVPVDRYISHEWHRREVEHLWSRVWQFACRVEEIPEVGDYHVYEIATQSYLIVRTSATEIKAYPNACLHRGRILKDYDGNCSEIRCPFHGFAWTLEGALADVPADWDFPHVSAEGFELPECSVGTWGGFVFINPDAEAEPLEDFLGGIVEQFEDWDLERRYKYAHVAKVVPANWKVAQEAFCEAYHVNATHPQLMRYVGDTNTQVDIWDNFARAITPSAVASPLLAGGADENEIMASMLDVRHDQISPAPVPEGATARAVGAAGTREQFRAKAGDWVDRLSDAEMIDSIDYTIFPNFHPWGAFNRVVYRFRPNGDDQRSSIMECILLMPYEGDPPPPCEIHWLGDGEKFTEARELGGLGKVFNQDLYNMGQVQRGLETTRKPGVTLGNYQESKIRWLHTLLGEWVDGGERA